jgi:O-succinylbenzoate synthase
MGCSLTITALENYQYTLALNMPFTVDGQPFSHREGLIVRLVMDDGTCGVGEVAPLPGYSRENMKKAIYQLKQAGNFLVGSAVAKHVDDLRKYFQDGFFQSQCPSVRFGIEMAVLQWLSVLNQKNPSHLLGCESNRDISCAGLLQGTLEEITSQTAEYLSRGCRTFKLKVGSKNIPLDVKKLQLVRGQIQPGMKIRLDVNQSWSLAEAMAFVLSSGKDNIEFIEEPLKSTEDLAEFMGKTGWAVALDEAIQGQDPDTFVIPPGVDVLVLKPMVLGGIMETLRWITMARKEGRQCVISSCFESGVGARMLANLAQWTVLDAGLGTSGWFKEDLLEPLTQDASCSVSAKQLSFRWEDLNHRKLTRI